MKNIFIFTFLITLLACKKENDHQPPLFGEAVALLNGVEWIGKSYASIYSPESGIFSITIRDNNGDRTVVFSGILGHQGHYILHPDSIGNSIRHVFALAIVGGDVVKGSYSLDIQDSQFLEINFFSLEDRIGL